MLWNWNVKDTCFLASGWHITSNGMMAASCIGVALLVVLLEALRVMGKKYDGMILAQMRQRGNAVLAASAQLYDEDIANGRGARQSFRPAPIIPSSHSTIIIRGSPVQQAIRAIIYAVVCGVAYIIMLLAMSFNGAIILSIVAGAGLGKFLTDWLSLTIELRGDGNKEQVEGIEESTVCCQ